ncbi:MAG: GFA family protein [Proteobacteria bacterium]|nr:GFA family protein [Pseudomonadota bacterium]
MTERWTGGCQCGAVRFAVEGPLGRASICHCRMCQKAFGSPFGALVSVPVAELIWTGERGRFQSSNKVTRGFCAGCGTPLTFEWGETYIDLAIAAFDRAGEITPAIQLDRESRLLWIDHVAALPGRPPQEAEAAAARMAKIVSYQHPDHD